MILELGKYAVTGNQMKSIEEAAVKHYSLKIADLMEVAGKAIADKIKKNKKWKKILVISGKGNNGGDGMVCARFLKESKREVRIELLSKEDNLPSLVWQNLQKAEAKGIKISEMPALKKVSSDLRWADVVVDGIFGFGFKDRLKGYYGQVVEEINESNKPVIAIDIPTGVDASTGKVSGKAVRAKSTVTFTCPKIGCLIYPGMLYTGDIDVVNIGIPFQAVDKKITCLLTDPEECANLIPHRRINSHKKSVGKVLVIAGSQGMTGAAVLACRSALRTGAGTVVLACPEGLNQIFEIKLTETMTRPLSQTEEGTISPNAIETVIEMSKDFDVILIGPGLSLNKETKVFIRAIIKKANMPIVIDADGLNALSESPGILLKRNIETIITPHPGELGRLLKISADEIQKDRLKWAKEAYRKLNAVTILKGERSLITEKNHTVINLSGNPGLSTAGTGDVLAGMIASLWAQGVPAFQAGILGTYLHGIAADIAVEELTEWGLLAGDVLKHIPKAIKRLLEYKVS
ncbi:MAG: NAD(P)H-hydrate dehydratase [Actinomycetia bacterium]|nr:NAD(P)H-hydrate dehydratase [Actinomycetes bacterium]